MSSYATQDAIWLKTHALCLNLVVASLGLYHFSRKGFLNIKFIIPFIITSIPFAYLGAYIPIIDWLFEVLLSVTLLWAAVRLLINVNKVKSNSNYLPKYGVCACYGAGLGFLSGLVGVGGGIFLSPIMILKGWVSTKETAASSALFIFVNSIAGLAGLFNSHKAYVNDSLLIQFIFSVLIGGLIGTRFGADHASNLTIRQLLSLVLVMAALRRIFSFFGLWV